VFEYSLQEKQHIDQQLDPLLQRAGEQAVEMQQLALDATRLQACTADRLQEYRDKGFFKRCWGKISGKTSSLERANVQDLVEMQRTSWRYLSLLQERDLMLASSIITVKNNLLTLAVKEEEARRAITEMAERIGERFLGLESRVGSLEVATNVHSWLLTLQTLDYEERFPPNMRLLRIVRDFLRLKAGDWSLQEIRYLQKAVSEVGLEAKRRVTLSDFLDGLIDEIEQITFPGFQNLACLPQGDNGPVIPAVFVLEQVAVPSFAALAVIDRDYETS
jgi:hypothetical protein